MQSCAVRSTPLEPPFSSLLGPLAAARAARLRLQTQMFAEAQPKRPLHFIDLVVHVRDLERRIGSLYAFVMLR